MRPACRVTRFFRPGAAERAARGLSGPQLLSAFGRVLGRAVLRAGGWRTEGQHPDAPQYVLIAAPHTSNWDFVWFIAIALALEVPVRWLGKHTLFRWPLGWLMRPLGGLPIERSQRQGHVERIAALFAPKTPLVLVFPAEGTRSLAPCWKSGFYHVARRAAVPVVLGYLDYRRKCGGFGPVLSLSGDPNADMDAVRAFYEGVAGRYPEKQGPIRLREEAVGPQPAA